MCSRSYSERPAPRLGRSCPAAPLSPSGHSRRSCCSPWQSGTIDMKGDPVAHVPPVVRIAQIERRVVEEVEHVCRNREAEKPAAGLAGVSPRPSRDSRYGIETCRYRRQRVSNGRNRTPFPRTVERASRSSGSGSVSMPDSAIAAPANRCERAGQAVDPEPDASSSSAWSGLKNTRSTTTALTVSSGRSTTRCVPSSLCSTGTIA